MGAVNNVSFERDEQRNLISIFASKNSIEEGIKAGGFKGVIQLANKSGFFSSGGFFVGFFWFFDAKIISEGGGKIIVCFGEDRFERHSHGAKFGGANVGAVVIDYLGKISSAKESGINIITFGVFITRAGNHGNEENYNNSRDCDADNLELFHGKIEFVSEETGSFSNERASFGSDLLKIIFIVHKLIIARNFGIIIV